LTAGNLTLEKIVEARRRLTGVAHHTPLDFSNTFSEMTGNSVFLKLENMQKTGSFKIRGAYNKVMSLSEDERRHGVIAASAGNHAQGVAYAATRAGMPCTVVMPDGAPISKVMATRRYGAKVVLAEGGYEEAYRLALELQELSGATYVHGFDDVEVMAGQGTIALELIEDMPEMEAILIPVGGGGLIAGMSVALKKLRPGIRIIGVQACGAQAASLSFKEGGRKEIDHTCTFADGISIRKPGEKTLPIILQYVDEIVTVDDEEIANSVLLLLERSKIVAEGAGAVGLAALVHKKTSLSGAKTVVLLSGGNIDVNILSIIIERGLVKSGRYVRLRAIITDQPGNLRKLLSAVADARANVITISHDRVKPSIPLKQAEVELALETRDQEHIDQILAVLSQIGYCPEIIS